MQAICVMAAKNSSFCSVVARMGYIYIYISGVRLDAMVSLDNLWCSFPTEWGAFSTGPAWFEEEHAASPVVLL